MYNLGRRLGKIEKKLGVGKKPNLVNIAGMVMTSDELKKVLKEIDGTSKGVLPSEEEFREYQALCAEDTEI